MQPKNTDSDSGSNPNLEEGSAATSAPARHPWLLTLYLLAVSVGAFVIPHPLREVAIPGLLLFQFLLLLFAGRLRLRSIGVLWRLKFLFLFFVLISAFFPPRTEGGGEEAPAARPNQAAMTTDPGEARIPPPDPWPVSIPGIGELKVYPGAMLIGLLFCGQIALVVLTSYVIRTIGEKDSFIRGLRTFRVTPLLAHSLDSTLALLEGDRPQGGRGGGGGGGGGRRRKQEEESASQANGPGDERKGLLAFAGALRKGDLSPFFGKIQKSLDDAKARISDMGLNERLAHDAAVIGGIGAVMMAFKLTKILPGIPIMSGAKAVFFIPLYVLAADRTHSRWGATTAGFIMGLLGFLNGDGRYGVFEILKHVVPGILLDLTWPILRRLPRKVWIYCAMGILVAIARTMTELCMVLALGAGWELFAFPALKLIPNLVAGFLSGFVVYPLLQHLARMEDVSPSSAA